MPKTFLIKLYLLVSTILPSRMIVIPSFDFLVSFPTLGGYKANAPDIDFVVTIKSNVTKSGIREVFSVGASDGNYTDIQTKAKHGVMIGTYQVTFKLPLSTYLTSTGLFANFQIYDSSGVSKYSTSFKLLPMKSETISLNKYLGSAYILSGTTARPGFVYEDPYSIGCQNLIDYFDIDTYHRLDLSKIKINYLDCYPLTYTSAVLEISGFYPAFVHIQNKVNYAYIGEIPLSIEQDPYTISFKFPSIMYVNPQNLFMSLTPKDGFVATKHFYLPVNMVEEVSKTTFTIKVKQFGYNKTNFNYQISYVTNRTLIGTCQGSEYCIVGEENND